MLYTARGVQHQRKQLPRKNWLALWPRKKYVLYRLHITFYYGNACCCVVLCAVPINQSQRREAVKQEEERKKREAAAQIADGIDLSHQGVFELPRK